MCFSQTASLVAFVIGEVGAILLWVRNKGADRTIAPVLATVALIQLIEFFIWRQADVGRGSTTSSLSSPASTSSSSSSFWTRALLTALALQAVVTWLVISGNRGKPLPLLLLAVGIYVIIIAWTMPERVARSTSAKPCQRMTWGFTQVPWIRWALIAMYGLILATAWVYIKPSRTAHVLVIAILSLLLISTLLTTPFGFSGSVWCLMAVLLPFILLIST